MSSSEWDLYLGRLEGWTYLPVTGSIGVGLDRRQRKAGLDWVTWASRMAAETHALAAECLVVGIDGVLVTALVTVHSYRYDDPSVPVPRVEEIASQVQVPAVEDAGPRVVGLVTLPIGPAVRTRWRTVTGGDQGPVLVDSVGFTIPRPAERVVLQMNGMSSSLDQAEGLAGCYDSLATTLAIIPDQ